MSRQTSVTAKLARYGFADSGRARDLLGPGGLRLIADTPGGDTDDDAVPLLDALARAADPDLALLQLQRAVEKDPSGGLLPALLADPTLRDRMTAVLGASSRSATTWSPTRGSGGSSTRPPRSASWPDATDVPALRSAYRRSLLHIVAEDLTGATDLEVTMAALSVLADATMEAALAIAAAEQPEYAKRVAARRHRDGQVRRSGAQLRQRRRRGVRRRAGGPRRANPEPALRAAAALASRMIQICGLVAWPVDAALRPEGSRGPLVRTLASHLAYYKKWARTWEFQALLKARPAAGDRELGAEWLAALQPLVWHAAERPEAVDDVRAMRRRIIDNVPAGRAATGRSSAGRAACATSSSRCSCCNSCTGGPTRRCAHRPHWRHCGRWPRAATSGRPTARRWPGVPVPAHRRAPAATAAAAAHPHRARRPGRAALARARHSGYRADARRRRRRGVQRRLARATPATCGGCTRSCSTGRCWRPSPACPATTCGSPPRRPGARLRALGFADPPGALRHLEALIGGVSRTAAIQRTLLPALLSEFADAPEPDRGLLAYRRVSDKLGSTPWYLRLLRDEGPVALRLARLLGHLPVRDRPAHPRPRGAAAPGRRQRARAAYRRKHCAKGSRRPRRGTRDAATAIAAVRALRRRELFRIACADLLGKLDAAAVAEALAQVTDATLAAALRRRRTRSACRWRSSAWAGSAAAR